MAGEFIQLNRTFHPLSDKVESDDDDVRQLLGIGKPLTWSDVLGHRRVVVLSEAGSGKTVEMRHTTQDLRKQGRHAFFIRLEHVGEDFESAFEEGTHQEFETWRDNTDQAWILLDSIDEVRLRDPRDFATAIRILGHRLGNAKQRAHIVLSGRSTAWRPKSDYELCLTHLGYVDSHGGEVSNEDDSEDESPEKGGVSPDPKPRLIVVALDDLRRQQIEIFVRSKGVQNTTALMDAVERADAWSYTARPQDLDELVAFWIDDGRIGHRLELMQNSIRRRLEERNQDHADARPLSAERSRVGARLVAAACTLSREPTIRVPDGLDNDKGLPIRSILADWDDTDCTTLLLRPIFDEAIYGAVRFHHRSVREFLTAEWFYGLLGQKTSRSRIERVFFRKQYDTDVVVPSMRPVLAWLVLLDEKICERTRKVAPEIFFEGGDPSQLPLAMRRQILRQVCANLSTGASTRSVQDYSAVQRFADEELTKEVVELIKSHRRDEDLLWFLLRMVWQGRMKGALPDVKAIALSASDEPHVRRAAIRAVAATGTPTDLAEVRASFVNEAPTLCRESLAELLSGLEPSIEAMDWFFTCTDKVELPKPHSVDNLIGATSSFVDRMDQSLLSIFVEKANERLDRPPVMERRHCEISKRYVWLLGPSGIAVHRLVEARDPAALAPAALALLHKLPNGQSYDLLGVSEEEFRFERLVPAWIELKFALFWQLVAHERRWLDRTKTEKLTHWRNVSIFNSYADHFGPEDFAQALAAVKEQALCENRMVALTLAFDLYTWNGRPAAWRRQLRRVVKGDSELTALLGTLMRPGPQPAPLRKYRRMTAEWERRNKLRQAIQAENEEKWREHMRSDPEAVRAPKIRSGAISIWQWRLNEKMREGRRGSSKYSEGNWETLKQEFGDEVATAFRDGAVAFWRRHRPTLLSEGAEANSVSSSTIFGLTGLAIEAREIQDWPKGLNSEEAAVAFRYAVSEINGFPHWMPKLYDAFPDLILRLTLVEIDYELSCEEADKDTHYILSDVNRNCDWLRDGLAPELFARLSQREPKNLRNLNHMLNVINGASTVSDEALAELAGRKSRSILEADHSAAWYATWVGTAPDDAIPDLETRLEVIESFSKQAMFAMMFVTNLMGSRGLDSGKVREHFRVPYHLKSLYLLMHRYIRRSDDIDRLGGGTYSPELRDDAQDGRNSLFRLLQYLPGKEAYLALTSIAEEHPDPEARGWFVLHAKCTEMVFA